MDGRERPGQLDANASRLLGLEGTTLPQQFLERLAANELHPDADVPADLIGSIYTTYVCTTVSADQAASLPMPEGSTMIDVKPARSVADRLGGMFGRRRR